jgi:hypothetical protein
VTLTFIIIKSGKLRWMGHETNTGEIRNVCRIFVGDSQVRRFVEDLE